MISIRIYDTKNINLTKNDIKLNFYIIFYNKSIVNKYKDIIKMFKKETFEAIDLFKMTPFILIDGK